LFVSKNAKIWNFRNRLEYMGIRCIMSVTWKNIENTSFSNDSWVACHVIRSKLCLSAWLMFDVLSQRFSVTDQALAWFQSYLTDRCQVFTTDSTQSAPIALSSGIPQGSGLGLTQFIAYTEDTTNIFPSHNIQYHLFADDTQSHGHCSIPDIPDLVFRLQECIKDLARSYASHRLQLNPSKSDFIWFGSRSSLSKIPPEFHSLTVTLPFIHRSLFGIWVSS